MNDLLMKHCYSLSVCIFQRVVSVALNHSICQELAIFEAGQRDGTDMKWQAMSSSKRRRPLGCCCSVRRKNHSREVKDLGKDEVQIKWSYDLRSYERNFCNCVEKPEKFRTSTGFEPVTSRFRCDALTNWAMKPMTLGAGHLWVLIVPWGMNQWWNGIWNQSYMNCGYEIKWSYDLRSYERNFCNCVEKPEKFRTSTGFEPVTSRFRCDALTNWAMKPLTLGAGHL